MSEKKKKLIAHDVQEDERGNITESWLYEVTKEDEEDE